jgi:transcriptional regulator with XRE-family HTH domain
MTNIQQVELVLYKRRLYLTCGRFYLYLRTMIDTMPDQKVHEGRNVKRIREILGIKQDTLAVDLGLSQQAVSLLEQRETIDPELMDKISKILKVPVEAIKNFNEEAAVNFISNTFNHSGLFNRDCTLNFNPLDKYVELVEKNEKLYAALLKEKDEKIVLLERLAGEKKK